MQRFSTFDSTQPKQDLSFSIINIVQELLHEFSNNTVS